MFPWPNHPPFNTPLARMPGISASLTRYLAQRGYHAFGDFLTIIPNGYQDRRESRPLSEAKDGEALFFKATVAERELLSSKKGARYLKARVEDLSGRGAVGFLFFFHVLPYFQKLLAPGRTVAVYGTAVFPPYPSQSGGRRYPGAPTFTHPEVTALRPSWDGEDDGEEALRGIWPVYGPMKGLSPSKHLAFARHALEGADGAPPLFPPSLLAKWNLKDPTELIRIVHAPPNLPGRLPRPRESRAFRSLVLLEMALWRTLILLAKEKRQETALPRPPEREPLKERFLASLPFSLSAEQARVLETLSQSLALPFPQNALLQGEVGSGKTAVISALLFQAAGQGRQGALIAPTELLARQHFAFLRDRAQNLGVNIAFLAGSVPAAEKKKVIANLASGAVSLAVGTQALFFPKVIFRDLALAVIDEQHRFGVSQRLLLREKNPLADVVSLSATPIPRSLAQALYGDMDIVSLKGTLPGRATAQTLLFGPAQKEEAYALFVSLLAKGERGFLISPRVGEEDGDGEDGDGLGPAPPEEDGAPSPRGPSLSQMEKTLARHGPDLRVGVIHGRQENALRSATMDAFRAGDLDALLSTTIVEVGVDIPEANVMMVEGAENMGLAQLHQLRGRVGRGGGAATLILLAHGEPTPFAVSRFEALQSGADGYALSELDLKLRGPGEELGFRQSGWPKFSFVKLPRDLQYLDKARALAQELLSDRASFPPALWEALSALSQSLSSAALGI